MIEEIGAQVETVLKKVPGTRSVFAERTGSGFFLDIEWDREALARYGLSVEEAQAAVENAIGGENVTTVIQGQERYPVNVRYLRDFRSDLSASSACWSRRRTAANPDPAGPTGPGHGHQRPGHDPQ